MMNAAAGRLFAASTLGVVDEDLSSTAAMMARHGVRAVEIRSAQGAFIHPGSDAASRREVRRQFEDAGMEIFSVASRVRIMAEGDDAEVAAALEAELHLASDLGAHQVRVFPGAPTVGTTPSDRSPELVEPVAEADARGVRRLLLALDAAAALGVAPLVETHDSHPRGEDVARLLAALDEAAPGHPVGAIWDLLHPWRVGEELGATAQHLGRHVLGGRGYVQIKDVADRADTFPVLQGDGAAPGPEFLAVLDELGYRGPVSLEWERFWVPTAPPLEAALGAAAAFLASH